MWWQKGMERWKWVVGWWAEEGCLVGGRGGVGGEGWAGERCLCVCVCVCVCGGSGALDRERSGCEWWLGEGVGMVGWGDWGWGGEGWLGWGWLEWVGGWGVCGGWVECGHGGGWCGEGWWLDVYGWCA